VLSAVGDAGDLVVIAGRSGAPAADAPVDRLLEALGVPVPPTAEREPQATGLLHAADADDEVRSAVRILVAALHREQAVSLERMAVLYSTPEPYGPLLSEHLAAAGLRHQGFIGRPLCHSLAGRALLSTLRRATAPDPVRRDLLMAELGSVPWWAPDRSGAVPAARWEERSRELGVAGGLDRWRDTVGREQTLLAGRAADLEAAVAAGEAEPWRLERDRRRLDELTSLLDFVESDAAELRALAGARTWAELAERCRARLRRVRLPRPDEDPGGVEQRAAEAVDRLLDGVVGLDQLGEPASPAALLQLVEEELERPTRRGGLGDGVLVGPLGAAAGLDLDLVVLVGLAEGDLPGRPVEDSLLLDAERASVGDALRPSRARVQQRHLDLLHAVAAGREVVLAWPRGDLRRSAQRLPSRWVVDQARRLGADAGLERMAADRIESLQPRPDWIAECPSFAGGLASVAVPVHSQEYRLAVVARTGRLPVGSPGFDDPLLARSLELVRARDSDRLTRFDGVLPPGLVPSPAADGSVVAPTRLEAWRRCPSAYLLQHVLGVRPVDEPEDLLEIDPLERGSLLHDVLEAWVGEHLADPPEPGQSWGPAALARLDALAEEHFRDAEARGVTGRPLLWAFERERLLRLLRATAATDDDRRAGGGLVPAAVELPFGIERPFVVQLPSGRRLSLRGRIDRVDRTSTGAVAVVDYKSGKGTGRPDFDPADPTGGGTQLQLPLYVLAAQDLLGGPLDGARADYWFLADQRRRGLQVDEDVAALTLATLDRLVDLMERGVFVALPKAPDTSPFVECDCCDPDGLGTGDAHRRWTRKLTDPLVADLVALIDGPAPQEDPA
jgi:RecB family exonuclease